MDAQYTATIYLIFFAFIIMIAIVRSNDMLEEKKKKEFISIFAIIMVAAGAEWLGNCLEGKGETVRWLHIVAKATDHSAAPAITVVFLNIVASREKAQKLLPVIVLHGILEIASGYWGFIYYIDKQSRYFHGKYYWIYVAVYIGSTIYLLVEAAKFSKKYQSTNRRILEMVFLFLLTGVALRLINSEIRVDYLCLCLDTIIMYIFYTDTVEKIDSITGLLNRRSYESYLSRMRKPAVILYLDVDDFKLINDRYGHHVGDYCLEVMGKTIQKIFYQYGRCYRIGGDEFCILLEKKMNSVDQLTKQLREELDQLRKKDQRIPYISVGYIFFNPDKTDVESALKEADAQMYRTKQESKKRRISAGQVCE